MNEIMVDKNKGLHGHLTADDDQVSSVFYHTGINSPRIENCDTFTNILTIAVRGNVETNKQAKPKIKTKQNKPPVTFFFYTKVSKDLISKFYF